MKRIELHHSFVKNYAKRIAKDTKLRAQYEARLDMFIAGQRSTPLNDHALTGDLRGRRSFSVAGDIRIIYIEFEDRIIFLDIGTHNQVY